MKPKIEARELFAVVESGVEPKYFHDRGSASEEYFTRYHNGTRGIIEYIEAQPALARIAELEAQNHRQLILISQLADECNSKDVTIAKLKACAEFYSDETEDGLDWNGVNNPAYIQDKGKLARTTLAEVAELEQKVRGRSD